MKDFAGECRKGTVNVQNMVACFESILDSMREHRFDALGGQETRLSIQTTSRLKWYEWLSHTAEELLGGHGRGRRRAQAPRPRREQACSKGSLYAGPVVLRRLRRAKRRLRENSPRACRMGPSQDCCSWVARTWGELSHPQGYGIFNCEVAEDVKDQVIEKEEAGRSERSIEAWSILNKKSPGRY